MKYLDVNEKFYLSKEAQPYQAAIKNLGNFLNQKISATYYLQANSYAVSSSLTLLWNLSFLNIIR